MDEFKFPKYTYQASTAYNQYPLFPSAFEVLNYLFGSLNNEELDILKNKLNDRLKGEIDAV